MKTTLKRTLLGAALAGLSTVALAGGELAPMNGNLYVTGAINATVVGNAVSREDANFTSKSDEVLGARVALGYQNSLSRRFYTGIETGFGSYGKLEYTDPTDTDDYVNYRYMGFDAAGLLGVRLNQRVSVSGKVGFAYLRNRYHDNNDGATGTGSFVSTTWDVHPLFGATVDVNVTRNFSLFGNYTHINGDPMTGTSTVDAINIPSLNTFNFGIKWMI